MRSTKKEPFFPYAAKTICYIEVSADGTIRQVSCSKSEIENACNRVMEKHTTLYAVWPGRYKSDLFLVDDINALSDAYGMEREKQHKHTVGYSLSKFDDGKSVYASVDLTFKCGCRLNSNNIKAIANDLKKQFGWEMATTRGIGSHSSEAGTIYSIRIRRTSLSNSKKETELFQLCSVQSSGKDHSTIRKDSGERF